MIPSPAGGRRAIPCANSRSRAPRPRTALRRRREEYHAVGENLAKQSFVQRRKQLVLTTKFARNPTSLLLVKEDVNLNLRYHVMTLGSGNDLREASLECDGGSGGCEDPRAGFGVTQEEAEAAAIAAARKSAWREADGRWLCPLCYWRVCYWQAISTAKPAHSQQRADSSLRPGQKQRIITWNNPEQRPFS